MPSPSEVHHHLTKLVFLGPPGSGKGTHARCGGHCFSVPQIFPGDLL
jgi:adenylate kinase family enzyme